MNDGIVIDGEVYVKKSNQEVDEHTQRLIESAKMIYKKGSCSDVFCGNNCPWYNEHLHSTFKAEPDYNYLLGCGQFSPARRRVAARWLIAHGVIEVDGKPVVVEPPQIDVPRKDWPKAEDQAVFDLWRTV